MAEPASLPSPDERFERGRARVSVAIAGLVHVSVILAMAFEASKKTDRPRPVVTPVEALSELDLVPLDEPAPVPITLTREAPTRAATSRSIVAGPQLPLAPEPRAIPPVADPPSPFGVVVMANPSLALTLSGPNALFFGRDTPEVARPPTATRAPPEPAKARVERALRRASFDAERARGVNPEGPIVTALTEATYAAPVPTNGAASFHVVVDARGAVTMISVASREASDAWEDVAKAALSALAKKVVRFTSAPLGAALRIEVTVGNKLPNGQAPGLRIKTFGVVTKEGEGKDSTTISFLDLPTLEALKALGRIPTLEEFLMSGPAEVRRLSEVDAVRRGMHEEERRQIRLPGNEPILGRIESDITLIGGNPDPSNIGAKPRIIVHTRTVSAEPL